jgi:hypothetical protein
VDLLGPTGEGGSEQKIYAEILISAAIFRLLSLSLSLALLLARDTPDCNDDAGAEDN